MGIFDFLNVPFGAVLGFIYSLVNSYGLAIILFTLVVKAIMFPLGIKQKKGMVRQMQMRPKEEAIRKKITDKQKQQEAIMALYKEEGYSPMGGCLPLLIQLPIIMSLYQVIQRPLTYILGWGDEAITAIAGKIDGLDAANALIQQIPVAQAVEANPALLNGIEGVDPSRILNLEFLGINLGLTPSFGEFNILWLIPVLAGVFALLSSLYSQRSMPPQPAGGGAMKGMTYIMPLFSVFIGFMLPAGVGLYWAASSLFSILQEWILNKMYKPKEAYEKALEEFNMSNRQKKKRKQLADAQKAALTDGSDTDADEAEEIEAPAAPKKKKKAEETIPVYIPKTKKKTKFGPYGDEEDEIVVEAPKEEPTPDTSDDEEGKDPAWKKNKE